MKIPKYFRSFVSLPLVCSALIFVFFALPKADAAGNGTKNDEPQKRVIIVSENGVWGDPVAAKLLGILKKEGCRVALKRQNSLRDAETKNFGAIVIVNRVMPGHKNHGVIVYLSRHEQKKIVLFNAVGADYWISGKDGTDRSSDIAADIAGRVRTVLTKKF